MRSQIYSIKTKSGQEFKLLEEQTIGGIRVVVHFIEHVEQIGEDDDGDEYLHGFYNVYGLAPESSELTKNGAAIRRTVHYKDVSEVDDIVPILDFKTRHEAYLKTMTDDYRERSTSLPKDLLLKQKFEIEKAIEALDAQDESDEPPETEEDKDSNVTPPEDTNQSDQSDKA